MSIGQASNTTTPQEDNHVLHPLVKRTITILLLGETGSGKTSFMSLLANLFQDKGVFELKEIHDRSRESGLGVNQSQTTKPTMYTIKASRGAEIRILDTPGLADTRGLDQDKKHRKEINDAIQHYVTSIDAVLIIANGTVQRLTAATEYTLSTITSMFPRSIIDNIGFLFTNSVPLRWSFDFNTLPIELQRSSYWLLENPLSMLKNFEKMQSQTMSSRHVAQQKKQLSAGYREAVEVMDDLLEWLDKRTVQPTKEIDNLYQISMNIEDKLTAALATLTNLDQERIQLKKIADDLENKKRSKKAIEDLIKIQIAPEWTRIDSPGEHHTICLAPGCYSNCHMHCALVYLMDRSEIGRLCASFSSQRAQNGSESVCGDCGHKANIHAHYFSFHHLRPRQMEPETRMELQTTTDAETRLTAAKDLAQRRQITIQEDMMKTCKQIQSLVDQYNQISLTSNFTAHIETTIRLLKLRREALRQNDGTENEVNLIDQSIKIFEDKVKVLNEAKRTRLGVMIDYLRGLGR
ncbi:AIG1 domain-containing protein [Ceratobasidium sp. AG-Ba]|nr:AIG1 domain-containing protein [Ceratobasidium sp. AG-Ba]